MDRAATCVRSADNAWQLATGGARKCRGNIHALSISVAVCDHFAGAVYSGSAACNDERAIRSGLNEVKEIGAVNSTTRTPDQTQVARLWANVGTPTNFLFVWNNVARTVSESRSLSTVERARLFALTNIALHDTLQVTFASKFHYGLWRPLTAIRRADEDGNANTVADPAWLSLIPTPPYPSYAGNMAAIGTSQSTILAQFFGRDDISFNTRGQARVVQRARTRASMRWLTNRSARVFTAAFTSRSTTWRVNP